MGNRVYHGEIYSIVQKLLYILKKTQMVQVPVLSDQLFTGVELFADSPHLQESPYSLTQGR